MKTSCVLSLSVLALCSAAGAAPALVDTSLDRVRTPLAVPFDYLGTIRPRHASEIQASNWTVGCEGLDRDFDQFENFRDYLEPLGIKTIRLQAGWAKCEKTPGTYDFTWLDDIIDYSVDHGLNVLLELGYGNPAYGPGGGTHLLGAAYPSTDEGWAAWDRWVDAITRRYRGKVRDWAMWNEPDIGIRYETNGTRRVLSKAERHTPEQIAAQNVRTARIVKANIPDARIGGLSLAQNNAQFLEDCLKAMGEDVKLFTWIIYHGYVWNPDVSYAEVEKQKAIVRKYNPACRLRQGENGCPSGWVHSSALAKYPWSEYSQAKWDMRRMLGDLGHDVESSVFTMMGSGENKSLTRRTRAGKVCDLKIAYYAVQNVASVFDATLVRVAKAKPSISTNDATVAVYEYRKRGKGPTGGRSLYVYWSHGDLKQFNPKTNRMCPSDSFEWRPAVFTVSRTIEDPVWCDLMTGKVYAFPKKYVLSKEHGEACDYKMVPVYDSPCILTSRALLDFVPAK